MHANDNAVGDIAVDLPFIRNYKNGHIESLWRSSFVPASEDPAASRGVATRDVFIDHGTGVSARLFLPSAAAATGRRLPIVVYVHGGSFCTGSAFCRFYHRYAASFAASAGALIVSVEYRLAPEYPVPAAYDDAWAALRWVASLSDPWLAEHADPRRMFLAGDSSGGNVAYHTAVRASCDAAMDIEGLVMVQPFFWGAERLPSEAAWDGSGMYTPELVDTVWPFVTAGQASNGDPRLNPPEEEIASLKCRRVLVAVAEKDIVRDRARNLAARMRDCAWTAGDSREVTLVEADGEDHGFHLYSPLRATSKMLMQKHPPSVMHAIEVEGKGRTYWALSLPTRPFKAVLTSTSLTIGRGKALTKTRFRSVSTQLPSTTYKDSFAGGFQGSYAMKNF
jgi:acetyl esterase/lipase